MPERRFHFTIDVDWIPGSEKGLQLLLNFCERLGLPASIFVAGRFAEVYPEILREAVARGHELGSHGWEHGLEGGENFRGCSYELQKRWMIRATESIERQVRVRPRMFRAPNLWVSETTLRVLTELDYLLDSSVPAQRFDLGYGQCNYVKYFQAPLVPYHPSEGHLGHLGQCALLEVAPSAFCCIPINMSALRVLPYRAITWAVRQLAERSSVLVFYVHPSEFVLFGEQSIPQNDPARYRNGLGPGNVVLLERFVRFIQDLGYRPALISDNLR